MPNATNRTNRLPESSGVYWMFHADTGADYIGSAKNIRQRCRIHVSDINAGRTTHRMREAFAGSTGRIRFQVLEECSGEQLESRERFWVEQLCPSINTLQVKRNRDRVGCKAEVAA